ncbi:TIGR03086 family metal-binding protein [Kitasatospora sp. NPDC051170]|uniref:TIGR03086 family metal-binding protein n=1 Tax=Kitasatospora sp. NPDC051170 TaxID=3364056 RepID=UPI0037AD34B5
MTSTQDPRPQYQAALDQLEALVATVTPADLDRPTPCEDYNLRQLLNHLVGATHRLAYMGEGGHAADHVPAIEDPADDAWAAALGRARTRVTAAWAEDGKLGRPTSAPWGEVPGGAVLGGYVMETVTHSWDIATSLDKGFELDEGLSGAALGIAEFVLPSENRAGQVPFGEVQPVADGADVHTRLAAFLGRKA